MTALPFPSGFEHMCAFVQRLILFLSRVRSLQITGLPSITAGMVTVKSSTATTTGTFNFENTPDAGNSVLRWTIQPRAADASADGYDTLVLSSDSDPALGKDDLSTQLAIRRGGAVQTAVTLNGEIITKMVCVSYILLRNCSKIR